MRARPGWRGVWASGTGVLAALVVSAAAVLSGAAASPAGDVIVRGSLTDASGAPIPAHTVRLLKGRTFLEARARRSRDQDVEEARARTDAGGAFEIRFRTDPAFSRYTVRFYDPATFDAVKYGLPDDRDISRGARQGGAIRADAVLRLSPDWPKVKEMVDAYGPGSPCGQVIRVLGIPTRRVAEGSGREVWDYPAAGVSYLVEGMKILETRPAVRSAQGDAVADPSRGAAPSARAQEQP